MKLLRPQYEAVQRHKEADRLVDPVDLPNLIAALVKQEKGLNDLYWSLFDRGVCSDIETAEYLKHERNALRVRIMRLQKRRRKG